jgi:MHS family alpha-ketoglutarate permease-like MFS transporter
MERIMVDQPSTATTPHSNLDTKTRLKSILGGSAGNLVEWYDWYVYAAFTLYFAHAFFPKGSQTAQLLQAAAIFAVVLCVPLAHGLWGSILTVKDVKRALHFPLL